MSLGFEQAGFRIACAVDLDRVHLETFSKNFPSCPTLRADISKVRIKQIRVRAKLGNQKPDVVFGGPPCQGFSLIGKRVKSDPRNRLIYAFGRAVLELRPRYFVLENVEGLLLGSARRTLTRFLSRIRRSGYQIVWPIKVLNASSFGVPQRRRRVFIIGCEEGLDLPEYPEPSRGTERQSVTVWQAIHDLAKIRPHTHLAEFDTYRGTLAKPADYARLMRGDNGTMSRTYRLSGCRVSQHTHAVVQRFKRTAPGDYEPTSRFYRLCKHGIAPTLRAGTPVAHGSYTAPRPIHPVEPRCITVREAARLHSFPDWFTFHPTVWHGFRQIGNSVPPMLARAVAETLIKALRKHRTR